MFAKFSFAKALIALVVVSILVSACGSEQPRIDKPGKPEGQVYATMNITSEGDKWSVTLLNGGIEVENFYVETKKGGFIYQSIDEADLQPMTVRSHDVTLNGYMMEGTYNLPIDFNGELVEFVLVVDHQTCTSIQMHPDRRELGPRAVRVVFPPCNRPLKTE